MFAGGDPNESMFDGGGFDGDSIPDIYKGIDYQAHPKMCPSEGGGKSR